jgi:hypothetical protein
MPRKVTKVSGMTPLQALIVNTMKRRGWDAPAVESRGVPHSTLHRYLQPTPLSQLPRARVMKMLADALELDVEEVRAAAFETVQGRTEGQAWRAGNHFPIEDGLEVAVMVDRIDRLPITEEQLQQGMGIARRWLHASSENVVSMQLPRRQKRAAAKGRSRGREARNQQDEAAEGSQE